MGILGFADIWYLDADTGTTYAIGIRSIILEAIKREEANGRI
jgi:hypothetical protein